MPHRPLRLLTESLKKSCKMQKPVVYYPKAFAGEKMKITDFIFKYETARWSIARVGICRVRIFSNSQNQIYVVLTELDENPGSSVTNTLEEILRQLLTAHFGGVRKAICCAS